MYIICIYICSFKGIVKSIKCFIQGVLFASSCSILGCTGCLTVATVCPLNDGVAQPKHNTYRHHTFLASAINFGLYRNHIRYSFRVTDFWSFYGDYSDTLINVVQAKNNSGLIIKYLLSVNSFLDLYDTDINYICNFPICNI